MVGITKSHVLICLNMNISRECCRGIALSRLYSSNAASIGPKFQTKEQVKEYLSKASWSIEDYLPKNSATEEQLPPKETVERLLKLSGLPSQDISEMQRRLANQLAFIDILHDLPVPDGTDASNARSVPRTGKPISYDQLLELSENETDKDESLGERSGSWESTKLSQISKNGYFVVREGLMKDRK